MGIEPMAAHMFILYYGCLSVISPPVAVAAFVAANLAGADPNKTGWMAMAFGWTIFVIPFLFVFSGTLLLKGDPVLIVHRRRHRDRRRVADLGGGDGLFRSSARYRRSSRLRCDRHLACCFRSAPSPPRAGSTSPAPWQASCCCCGSERVGARRRRQTRRPHPPDLRSQCRPTNVPRSTAWAFAAAAMRNDGGSRIEN